MALRIGDILVKKGFTTQERLKMAVEEQLKTGEALGRILVRLKFVTEKQMLEALAEQQGMLFVDIKDIHISDKAIKGVPAKFIWHYKIIPVNIDNNILTLAVSDPFDMWPVDDLEAHLGYKVERVLSAPSDIAEAIKKYYGVGADTIESLLSKEEDRSTPIDVAEREKVEDLEKLAGDASVIKLVNQILQQAINDRATDIHLEHFREDVFLRYRIDGILYDTQVSENIKYLYPAVISRIKIMANMDIVERRLPQDGRAKVRIGQKEYELRISAIPTLYGENIVIRILPTTMLFSIADLGMSKGDDKILMELISQPHGIIFVTGPTGSGKTTTLYACLSKLNTREVKIVTIEDPIEYELKGISQTQINPKIGLTFATMLRSMLRHDPDIMMVGEVRDVETADVTIQTALTGHLVFSTIHTNDAASGATRLIDIGVEPYLVASSVNAFIAQRLVRLICKNCKEEIALKNGKLKIDGINMSKEIVAYHGRGCKACNHTGYSGRTGIYEILIVTDEIRELIIKKTPSEVIKKKAVELGMRTLLQDGWEKIRSGVTTVEEIMRVTQLEQ
ncbi:MAG: ATPase, T2SS/T4P/T4SS family [Candidatus Omnitrophota bacterium]